MSSLSLSCHFAFQKQARPEALCMLRVPSMLRVCCALSVLSFLISAFCAGNDALQQGLIRRSNLQVQISKTLVSVSSQHKSRPLGYVNAGFTFSGFGTGVAHIEFHQRIYLPRVVPNIL